MKKIFGWVLSQAREKLDLRATWRELRELGKRHGKRFFWAALAWEIVEDVVFPLISWAAGMPELIPLFLIMHFEPVVYPMFFWAFRMWDRAKGREPWEPDRKASSSYSRSAIKTGVCQLAITGYLYAVLSQFGLPSMAVTAFVALMTPFGFVHERIWHDSNFGIRPDDSVEPGRILAKTASYNAVSLLIMVPVSRAFHGSVPWAAIATCGALSLLVYATLEAVWSKSAWGLSPVRERHVEAIF